MKVRTHMVQSVIVYFLCPCWIGCVCCCCCSLSNVFNSLNNPAASLMWLNSIQKACISINKSCQKNKQIKKYSINCLIYMHTISGLFIHNCCKWIMILLRIAKLNLNVEISIKFLHSILNYLLQKKSPAASNYTHPDVTVPRYISEE